MVGGAGRSAPIGIFDSGIGGLTVAAEIMRQLPSESFIYFGDTARLPYGPKSPETVLRYSREIVQLLQDRGVKAIVIACNTATAHALGHLRSELTIPIIGVIEPGARAAVRAAGGGRIGVIGTRGTIQSSAYTRAIHALDSKAHVVGQACPLFVPIVEEGWADSSVAEAIALEYLSSLMQLDLRALVLGCTHYPLLKPLLSRLLGDSVMLIDSAEETAAETRLLLSESGLAAQGDAEPTYTFIASDAPEQFLDVGQRFLGAAIERVETVLLG